MNGTNGPIAMCHVEEVLQKGTNRVSIKIHCIQEKIVLRHTRLLITRRMFATTYHALVGYDKTSYGGILQY